MPLIKSKSKKAVGENIKAEMEAGKPHKQSIAIALSVQRAAKKKKMAEGGEVEAANDASIERQADHMAPRKKLDFTKPDEGMTLESIKKENYADGGEVDLSENAEEEPNDYYELNKEAAHKELYDLESQLHDHESMAQAIRRKMAAKRG